MCLHSYNMTDNSAPETTFTSINRRLWNDKVNYHVASAMYNVPGFIAGNDSLNKIEIDLLGDLQGKRILHLQCHFGLDSLSLARRGAQHVTGVDMSDKGIDKARELAETINLTASTRFICCNIYDLQEHLSCDPNELFDIVFTSYGVTTWLPDMDKWASLISQYLKPNGTFIIAEFHPVICMFNEPFSSIEESYFKQNAIISQCQGTYADRDAPISNPSIEWNHSLSEVLQSLINHNLRIDVVQEFDYSPYDCFLNSVKTEDGFYQIKGLEKKIPIIYAIKATKIV
jgi:2-polyprenyl-3-methyl-5-hydroxy-6-metoxy-1,4-benzoquinol methylase